MPFYQPDAAVGYFNPGNVAVIKTAAAAIKISGFVSCKIRYPVTFFVAAGYL
jgi:hypothetical protein